MSYISSTTYTIFNFAIDDFFKTCDDLDRTPYELFLKRFITLCDELEKDDKEKFEEIADEMLTFSANHYKDIPQLKESCYRMKRLLNPNKTYDAFLTIVPYIEKVKETNYSPMAENELIKYILSNASWFQLANLKKCARLMIEINIYINSISTKEKSESLDKILGIIYA